MSDKDDYVQKMQAHLQEWMAEVDRFKATAAKAGADSQQEMERQIQALEGKINEGQAKLAELRDTSEEAWKDVKGGLDSAWEDLKTGFSDAAAKFKD